MSMRKKLIAAMTVLILALSVGAYGTLAYLTTQETAHNVITTGNVAIELLDKTAKEGESITGFDEVRQLENFTAAYPDGMPIMPGSEASKIVAVLKRETSAPCWVRVRLGQDLKDADGNSVKAEIMKDGDVEFVLDTENWVERDGWYYYKEALTNENSQTLPLLTEVKFSISGIDNSYIGTTYSIDVYAQAVQSENNDAEGVLGAQGWPKA